MTATGLGIASLVVAAAGTGYGIYSSNQAAKTQDTFALLNAQAGRQQGQLQARLAMAQAMVQKASADAQQRAGMANANAIRGDAEARTRVSQENIIRTSMDHERFISSQRSLLGAGGLVDSTGSPLDLLADSASAQQMQLAEMHYQTDLERRQLFREASATELGARMDGLEGGNAVLRGMSQAAAARMSARQATITGYSESAKASAMRTQGYAQGLSNLGGMAKDAYGFKRDGTFG